MPSTDPGAPDFAWWPIERVKPWVQNPRKNARAVGKVADSIRRWGWGRPLVVNVWPSCEGELIIGHTAWLAAHELKLEQVPVRVRRMEPAAAHALAIADNKLGEIADWDPDELGRIVGSGEIGAADLAIAGFTEAELRALNNPGQLDEDNVPEPPRVPITQPGDLWILGEHRLVCGDCTRADHVALALGGGKPNLLTTDPPYGINYDPSWRDRSTLKKFKARRRMGTPRNDHRASWLEAWQLFKGDVVYVWHAALHATVVATDLEKAGFEQRSEIIWSKPHFVIGRGNYHPKHEPCWYGVRKGGKSHWVGDRKQTTVWDIAAKAGVGASRAEDAITEHTNQKPLECMARPMRNHDGDVADFFAGSGTSFIAAQKLGRRCYGLELDPAWCDVIVERWKALTGGAPEHQVQAVAA